MDKEKVIKETEDGITFAESRGFGGLANTMRDVLVLIKEQDKIIQNILLEKANELNDKVATLQIGAQNREIRRISEKWAKN